MKRAIIIGVAGHVDHGKTWLTRALTGVDTDRLPEEKARGLSMVPGFAPLTLQDPAGSPALELGLIDVPGHERFIRQMLSGVSGLDMALLVVAADEGPKPQTVEHLQLLRLLGVTQGLAVLTKCDAADEAQIETSLQATRALLQEQGCDRWPQLCVSARSGHGLDTLRAALYRLAAQTQPRPCDGAARLPLDRAFSRPGWGPIVTGTLWGGRLRRGQELELWQMGAEQPQPVRIRALQVFGADREGVSAGQRVALNLTGEGAKLARAGDWLAEPCRLQPGSRLDVALTLLPEARSIAQAKLPLQQEVTLFHGASSATARLRLPLQDPAGPLIAQIEPSRRMSVLFGDRVILRSSDRTLGGGRVLAIDRPRLKLNRQISSEQRQQTLEQDPLLTTLERAEQPMTISELLREAAWPGSREAAQKLLARHSLLIGSENEPYYWSRTRLQSACQRLHRAIDEHFQQNPLSPGLTLASYAPLAQLDRPLLAALLPELLGEDLVRAGKHLRPRSFSVPEPYRQQAQKLLAVYQAAAWQPPTLDEAGARAGLREETARTCTRWLQKQGLLLAGPNRLFAREALTTARKTLAACFGAAPFSLAQARDRLGLGRKATQELLETLDTHGFTRQQELLRVLIK